MKDKVWKPTSSEMPFSKSPLFKEMFQVNWYHTTLYLLYKLVILIRKKPTIKRLLYQPEKEKKDSIIGDRFAIVIYKLSRMSKKV